MSALVAKELQEQNRILEEILTRAYLDRVYPVGSVYINVNNTNPSNFIGGTWERIKDRFLLSAGDTYSAGQTGGNADAVLIKHAHDIYNPQGNPIYLQTNQSGTNGGFRITVEKASNGNLYSNNNDAAGKVVASPPTAVVESSVASDGTGKNMPPYLTVYMWKRIA